MPSINRAVPDSFFWSFSGHWHAKCPYLWQWNKWSFWLEFSWAFHPLHLQCSLMLLHLMFCFFAYDSSGYAPNALLDSAHLHSRCLGCGYSQGLQLDICIVPGLLPGSLHMRGTPLGTFCCLCQLLFVAVSWVRGSSTSVTSPSHAPISPPQCLFISTMLLDPLLYSWQDIVVSRKYW